MAKATTITTNSDALSRAADAVMARGPKPSKNAILNAFAAAIAGPGKDWGFIKNAPDGQLTQPGVSIPSKPDPSTECSVFVVFLDEREDWAAEPTAYTSLDELKQGLRTDFSSLLKEHGRPLEETIQKLIENRFLYFPETADEAAADWEECEQPSKLEIFEFKVAVPSGRQYAWALEMDEKSGWGWSTRLFSSKQAALAAAAETIPRDRLGRTSFEQVMSALAETGEFDTTPEEDLRDDEDEDDWFDEHDNAFLISIREIPIEGASAQPAKPEPREPSPEEIEKPCEILYHPKVTIGWDQGLEDGALFFNQEVAEVWAAENNMDKLQPDWRDHLFLARDCEITADFRAETWVRDHAMAVDPQGDTSWDILAHELEPARSDLDYLQTSQNAPDWVRDWVGPFEIYLSITTPSKS